MVEEQLDNVEPVVPGKKHVDHRWAVGIIAAVVIVAALAGAFVYKYYNDQTVSSYDSIKTILIPKTKESTKATTMTTTTTGTTSTVTDNQLNSQLQSANSKMNDLDTETKNVDSSLSDTPVNLNY